MDLFEKFTGHKIKCLTSFENFVLFMYQPTDAASIGVCRMLFGIMMLLDIPEERSGSELDFRWGEPRDCRFPLLPFLLPLSLPKMGILYVFMWFGALGITLGYKFKISCILFVIPYWYIFLLDKSSWNNHSYLYGLIGILFLMTDAQRWCSIDALKNPTQKAEVPFWNYFLLKYQFFILYFVAGLKKFSSEWLSGYAMTNLSYHWVFSPFRLFLGPEMTDLLIIHWFGCMFDLTVAFFLIYEMTRPMTSLFAAAFHLMNSRLFTIGMFPWVCLAEMPLFYKTNWPRILLNKLSFGKIYKNLNSFKKQENNSVDYFNDKIKENIDNDDDDDDDDDVIDDDNVFDKKQKKNNNENLLLLEKSELIKDEKNLLAKVQKNINDDTAETTTTTKTVRCRNNSGGSGGGSSGSGGSNGGKHFKKTIKKFINIERKSKNNNTNRNKNKVETMANSELNIKIKNNIKEKQIIINSTTKRKKVVMTFMLIYCALQAFLPYSHFITKGYNNWTNGLYGYSWDMMLHAWDTVLVSIKIIDNNNGRIHFLEPYAFSETDRWTKHGDMAIQYAHCIKKNLNDDIKNKKTKLLTSNNFSIYFDVWCSLNGRFQQRFFNPTIDLLRVDWSPFKTVYWVLPLLKEFTYLRPKLYDLTKEVLSWNNHTDAMFIADFPGMIMENYISPDLDNITLTVLEGKIEYNEENSNETIILTSGQLINVKSDIFHKIKTISDYPSNYMYSYVNKTMEIISTLEKNKEKETTTTTTSKTTKKTQINNNHENDDMLLLKVKQILPLLDELRNRWENYKKFFAHVANSILFELYSVPMPIRIKDLS